MQHLPTDAFLHVAGYLGVRDLKAISMTCHSFSKLVHHDESTLWKDHFYRRWNRFNFALDLSLPCVMSELLRQQCHTASYRFLTHLVQRLPAYADVDHTHTKAVLEHADGFADAPLTIAYDGNVVGGDRCGWEYGETFGVGDTVGCSFMNNASVVFTRNGQVAGPPIPCAPSSPMYPIVGVDSPDAIEWNFGHKPFAFDGLALESCDEVQDESSIGEGLEYYTFALDDDDDEWDDEFVYHEDEDDLEYDEPSEYDDEDDMEPMEE
ncbi:hypothetical protein DYB28_008996 [Aphanomyces astaci]|uniref:F-box domain-containing protein n=2 Tax=Aphanomyces astaci TaxID=112090 RepID=A0A397ABA0_APHAT|nr:hypothetical protein DYB36_008185 [Aphanomyces astaci]RLO10552.1 hypothetical protein DYB28_008996 [Aphanomyces astaci]